MFKQYYDIVTLWRSSKIDLVSCAKVIKGLIEKVKIFQLQVFSGSHPNLLHELNFET